MYWETRLIEMVLFEPRELLCKRIKAYFSEIKVIVFIPTDDRHLSSYKYLFLVNLWRPVLGIYVNCSG